MAPQTARRMVLQMEVAVDLQGHTRIKSSCSRAQEQSQSSLCESWKEVLLDFWGRRENAKWSKPSSGSSLCTDRFQMMLTNVSMFQRDYDPAHFNNMNLPLLLDLIFYDFSAHFYVYLNAWQLRTYTRWGDFSPASKSATDILISYQTAILNLGGFALANSLWFNPLYPHRSSVFWSSLTWELIQQWACVEKI